MPARQSRLLLPSLAAAIAGAIFGGIGGLLGSSETLLRSSFESALNPSASDGPKRIATKAPISGSESFWLTAMREDGSEPVSKAVAIGDKIAMTLDGKQRSLEVVSVSEFTPARTEIDTRSGSVRLVIVTMRDTQDNSHRPVRLVMELESAGKTVVERAPRTGHTL